MSLVLKLLLFAWCSQQHSASAEDSAAVVALQLTATGSIFNPLVRQLPISSASSPLQIQSTDDEILPKQQNRLRTSNLYRISKNHSQRRGIVFSIDRAVEETACRGVRMWWVVTRLRCMSAPLSAAAKQQFCCHLFAAEIEMEGATRAGHSRLPVSVPSCWLSRVKSFSRRVDRLTNAVHASH